MRVALLSDIHGNAPALRAMLGEVEREGVDELWFLGDILGYGPLPVTCINLLDRWSPSVWLMGNHDLGTLRVWEGTDIDHPSVRQMAPGSEERRVFAWHAVQLQVGVSEERIQQLQQAPTWQRVDDQVYVAHGAVLSSDPDDEKNIGPNAYCHPWGQTADSMLDKILEIEEEGKFPSSIVVGHTHRPTLGKADRRKKPPSWEWEAGIELYEKNDGLRKLPEPGNSPVVICPGSVGQPRFVGRDRRAAYAVLDLEQGTVHFKRIAYDEGEFRAAMVPQPVESSTYTYHEWKQTVRNILTQWERGEIW